MSHMAHGGGVGQMHVSFQFVHYKDRKEMRELVEGGKQRDF